MKKIFALLLAALFIFSGCSKQSNNTDPSSSFSTAITEQPDSEMFTSRDREIGYDEDSAVKITLNGSTALATSDSVKISDGKITITEEATYIVAGSFSGMLIVNATDTAKIQIVLDGAEISSESSAALYVLEADKVFVTLVGENNLSNGGSFIAVDDNNIDAAVFSKQDITFNGEGTLTVNSPAGHGIVSKDDLVLTSGKYIVNSASHALEANDSIRVAAAEMTLAAGKDGIHAENNDDAALGFVYIESGILDISAEGDGISAAAYMKILDGSFDIVSGGGSENAEKQTSDNWGGFGGGMGGGGMMRPRTGSTAVTTEEDSSASIKGIKSSGNITISGGDFVIDSADDSVHSNASITVSGGSFEIASGDDAFHADETLAVSGGTINITESYEGLEGLHIKVSGGDIKLTASDDGLNAAGGTDQSGMGGFRGNDRFGGGMGGMNGSSNGSIVISGGNLYVNASGDGIDANGYLEITGGYTVVCGPTQGDTATLDYDTSATISGGTFIGTGASGMAQTFSDSDQGVVAVSVGNQSASTEIILKDEKGNIIISHSPELSFAVVILSSPDIEKGESYTITVGSTSGSFEAN